MQLRYSLVDYSLHTVFSSNNSRGDYYYYFFLLQKGPIIRVEAINGEGRLFQILLAKSSNVLISKFRETKEESNT